MTNRYFNNTPDLQALTRARADQVEANFDAVGAGFDAVQIELDRAIRVAVGDLVLSTLPDAATRAFKTMYFDGAGQLGVTTIASSAQMDAAVAAAVAAVAADASATAAAASVNSSLRRIALHSVLLGLK